MSEELQGSESGLESAIAGADPLPAAMALASASSAAADEFLSAQRGLIADQRHHLKWGEALGYAGKPDEARKQFALAAGLDLTQGQKAELSRARISQ